MSATTTTGRSTMLGRMAPRRKDEHRIEVDPAYRRALAKRVEALATRGITLLEVATEAKVGRQSLWRLLRDGDQRATVETAERVRLAVMRLDPRGPRIPPPALPTGGPGTTTYTIALRSDRKR